MTDQEERAFGAEMRGLQRQVLHYTLGLTKRNHAMAEDVASEAMMRAWAARHRFQPGTNMRGWLFTIARNIFLSQMRRARFSGGFVDDLPPGASADLTSRAGQEAAVHLADLAKAMMKLPAEQRTALMLVGAEGYSYEETADRLGVPLGTIKSRVCRGREALAKLLQTDPQHLPLLLADR